MRQILHIGHSDIRLFLSSKASYVWLLVVPLVFVYFFGSVSQGPGNPSSPRPSVLIENQDDGFLSDILLRELDAQGLNRVALTNQSNAERGIRIPEGFTGQVVATQQVKLAFFQVKGSGDPAAAMIELRLFRSLVGLNSRIFETANLGPAGPAGSGIQEALLRQSFSNPPAVPLDVRFAGRKPIPVGFNHSLPGNLVMFLMMNLLIFGGASLAGERQAGVLKRFAAYPIRPWELVIGKVYGRWLLGLFQVVFFLLLGQFAFDVNIGQNPFGVLLLLAIYCWVAASLGVLIGSVTASPDKTIPICVLASMVMAALGGCWWPLEVVPEAMRRIAFLFPTGWTLDGLHQLITFGGTLGQASTHVLVLLGFAAGANLLAGRVFRYG